MKAWLRWIWVCRLGARCGHPVVEGEIPEGMHVHVEWICGGCGRLQHEVTRG